MSDGCAIRGAAEEDNAALYIHTTRFSGGLTARSFWGASHISYPIFRTFYPFSCIVLSPFAFGFCILYDFPRSPPRSLWLGHVCYTTTSRPADPPYSLWTHNSLPCRTHRRGSTGGSHSVPHTVRASLSSSLAHFKTVRPKYKFNIFFFSLITRYF